LFIMIWEEEYLGKWFWKEAMQWILNFAFKELELHKVCLWVYEENKSAVNLYKKLWFEIEWTLIDDAYFGWKFHNSLLMAVFNK